MTACIPTIQNTPNPDMLLTDVTYQTTLSPQQSKIYALNIDASQQVTINVVVNSVSVQNINLLLTIYNSNLVVVRQTTLTAQNSNSITDLDEGSYFVCLRVIIGSYTVSTRALYNRFIRNVTIDSDISHCSGVLTSVLKMPRIPVACNQPLRYEIVEGSLPDGLVMTQSGFISGTLPIIDETEIIKIPSTNLFVDENTSYTPIGQPYSFKVRLSLVNDPSVFVIGNFFIAIVNNWSLSEDSYEIGTQSTTVITDLLYTTNFRTTLLLCCDNTENNVPNYKLTTVDGRQVTLDTSLDVILNDEYTALVKEDTVKETLVDVVTFPSVDSDVVMFIQDNYNSLIDSGNEMEALDYYLENRDGVIEIIDGVKILTIEYFTSESDYASNYDKEQGKQLMMYNPQAFMHGGSYASFDITTV